MEQPQSDPAAASALGLEFPLNFKSKLQLAFERVSQQNACASTVCLLANIFVLVWLVNMARRSFFGAGAAVGPKGWPVIGNLLEMMSPDVHRKLTAWANQYGGLYYLNMMGRRILVLTDPSLVGPLIGRGAEALPKAAFAYDPTLQTTGPDRARNLFTYLDTSPKWRHIRKTLATSFSLENVRKSFPYVKDHTSAVVGIWEDALKTHATPSAVDLDIYAWMLCLTMLIIGHEGFGVDFGALEGRRNDQVQAINSCLEELSKNVTNPFRETMLWLLPFTSEARRVAAEHRAAYALYDMLVDAAKQRGPPQEEDHSIWANLMRLRDESGQADMDRRHLAANFAAMLIGGYETTATALAWALYDIARNPEVQRKLDAELAAAGLLGSGTRPGARELEWADVQALPYFSSVLKESMRLHLIAGSTSTVRVADHDVQLGKTVVRKGTIVWMPMYAIANSRHNFVQPDRFWPERWERTEPEPGSGDATPAGNARCLSGSFLPFSDGPRNCIGQNLAMMSLRTILLLLTSRFWFEVDSSKMPCHAEVEAGQVMELAIKAKTGIHLKVRPHNAMNGRDG